MERKEGKNEVIVSIHEKSDTPNFKKISLAASFHGKSDTKLWGKEQKNKQQKKKKRKKKKEEEEEKVTA